MPNSGNHRDGARQAVIGITLVVGMVLLVVLAVGAQRAGLVTLLLLAVAVSVASVRVAVPEQPLLRIADRRDRSAGALVGPRRGVCRISKHRPC
jgi:hypothetical protein